VFFPHDELDNYFIYLTVIIDCFHLDVIPVMSRLEIEAQGKFPVEPFPGAKVGNT